MITEQFIENFTLKVFGDLEYGVLNGPDIAPGEPAAERDTYQQVLLAGRLQAALQRINPTLPDEVLEEAFRKVERMDLPSLAGNNRAFHRMLVNGLDVEFSADGRIKGDKVWLIDFDHLENNDWLVVNQFTVVENHVNRRPDVVIFVNGLPLGVIELKNAADEKATIWAAFDQLQTYKQQISSLFIYNEALIISDGVNARLGTLTANREWFLPWKTVAGDQVAPPTAVQLDVLLRGVFHKRRFLDLLRYFIVFNDDGSGQLVKKLAGYHQFHAVNMALEQTIRATQIQAHTLSEGRGHYYARAPKGAKPGDQRIGVVWHTQGSGKSLTMVFYTGRLVLHPQMENPTILVITDRNDLDDQLFGTFARCKDLLRQSPIQAESHNHLKQLLRSTASGGIYFTTVQKFLPPVIKKNGVKYRARPELLSERQNIVVIADEAHRSQYDFVDGYASALRTALPNASFIGFTGTPIELKDANTRAVFGDYISIYDIQQAVQDGATVPIYYEGRLAKLELKESEKPKIDPEFDEVTEGEETEEKEKLKTKWSALEAVVGTDTRIALIAKDFLYHFDQRSEVVNGKVMIVCMSRRICVELYQAIIDLRPAWHSDDDQQGVIKVVMTGSASDTQWQNHIRNKEGREKLAKRFKDPQDPFKIAIVRDMWLTGFDVPPLHTMYIDKPMQGHGLMQAIARVNRVYGNKPGGLIVDYLGLAYHLQQALAVYSEGDRSQTAIDQDQAVAFTLREYEICRDMFHGFDYSKWATGNELEQLSLLNWAQEHILAQEDGKQRLLQTVTRLSQAFALAVPHEKVLTIRDEVGFFQAVRARIIKSSPEHELQINEVEQAIRQIISRAVASDEVIDIFRAAGLKKPDISILSDEFLNDVNKMPQQNVAVELLRKLLNDEIKVSARKNIVQSRSFAKMLERTIRSYQNRAIEVAEVVAELINIAKEMREAAKRGEAFKLSEEELAFYDALGANDSAVQALGDDTLRKIAQELVDTVRKNVSIDWTVKENVQAKLRVMVKRILRKYGYPPDKQDAATQTVLEQATLIAKDWAE